MADQVRIFKHYARCVLQVVQTRLEEFARESEVFIFKALKLHNIAAVADARVVKRLGDRQVNGDESRKRIKLAKETEEVKNRMYVPMLYHLHADVLPARPWLQPSTLTPKEFSDVK